MRLESKLRELFIWKGIHLWNCYVQTFAHFVCHSSWNMPNNAIILGVVSERQHTVITLYSKDRTVAELAGWGKKEKSTLHWTRQDIWQHCRFSTFELNLRQAGLSPSKFTFRSFAFKVFTVFVLCTRLIALTVPRICTYCTHCCTTHSSRSVLTRQTLYSLFLVRTSYCTHSSQSVLTLVNSDAIFPLAICSPTWSDLDRS